MKKLCLNMIVKNESHVIEDTFRNLLSYMKLDYYVICDTGSTDNTPNIIEKFFKEKEIPGEIFHHEWKDFGTNRSLALQAAYGKSEYLLIFDADDRIHGTFTLPKILNKDRYHLKFGKGFCYERPLLINNRLGWKFVGVLHEYLSEIQPCPPLTDEIIQGNYYIDCTNSGGRSKNPNKYSDDAKILEAAFHLETQNNNRGLASRYCFYCAQSYKDAGNVEKAIEWYQKTLTLESWAQEKYVACLYVAELFARKEDWTNAQKYYVKTIEYDPERIEGISKLLQYLQKTDQHLLVNLVYHRFKDYKEPSDEKLFYQTEEYRGKIEYFNSISAYYIKDHISGYDCCKKIIMGQNISPVYKKITSKNIMFYKDQIQQDKDTLQFFYRYDEILSETPVEKDHVDMWELLLKTNTSLLAPMFKAVHTLKNKSRPTVFLSMTTCRRRDLFELTVRSFLVHCEDVSKIEYWFCVDDHSSDKDRSQMRKEFPWFDFYWKDSSEKGHRQSMNIIWDKISELKPRYWIHLEDDFFFFHKTSYVSKSIEALQKLAPQGIHQILWNRNYAETIDGYSILGHKAIPNMDKIVLHQHGIHGNYRNCHYWPHFSFRPSMILVDSIIKLGNFDSPNTFFERDYADRWNSSGFQSAFFNRICCKHIGKLTSETNKKNAYQLNELPQFNSTTSPSSPPSEILISMTSVPRRFNTSLPEVISKLVPNKYNIPLVLVIPQEYKKFGAAKIPQSLLDNKNIIVYRPQKDYGPATKLLGALEYVKKSAEDKKENKYKYILTHDDDLWYENFNTYLDQLMSYISKYPETAITVRGIRLQRPPYHFTNGLNYHNVGVHVDVPSGFLGVLYPLSKIGLQDRIFEFQKECPSEIFHDDDVFFGIFLGKEKIPIFAMPPPPTRQIFHQETNKSAVGDLVPCERTSMESFLLQWAVEKKYLPNPFTTAV